MNDKRRYRGLTRKLYYWRQRHEYFNEDLTSARNRMLLGFHVQKPKEGDEEGEEFEWVVTLRAKKDTSAKAWGKNLLERFIK